MTVVHLLNNSPAFDHEIERRRRGPKTMN